MKKTLALAALLATQFVFAEASQAITINAGPFGTKYTDYTFTDFNQPEVSGLPLQSSQDPNNITGNVWGIFSLTGVHTLLDGNPEHNSLSGVPYYSPGDDGKYYFGVYGGLTYMNGTAPGSIRLGAASGITPYLQVFETTNPAVYDTSAIAGPNVPGAGALGTFGMTIIYGADGISGTADDPTLWLDATFSPNTLSAYDALYQPGELELLTLSSSVTGSAEAYLDILGGTGAYLFQKGVFDLSGILAGSDRADLKEISDITTNFNGSVYTNPFGWTSNSQDPITGVGAVPEPSTIILLGAGLLGVGILGRKRMKK